VKTLAASATDENSHAAAQCSDHFPRKFRWKSIGIDASSRG
jgi:hypothetical protein